MPWVNARVAYLLAVQWATATIKDGKAGAGEWDPSEYDKIVTIKDTNTIDAFSSHVIHARMRTAHTGEGINVMTQALCMEDGSLPLGPDGTECFYGVTQWQQECHCGGEK